MFSLIINKCCSIIIVLLFVANVSNQFVTNQEEAVHIKNYLNKTDSNHNISKIMDNKNNVPVLNDINDFESALSSFIKDTDKLVLLLDYDGTLAPITTHPNFTVIEPESLECIHAFTRPPLCKQVYVGLISGRGADDVKSKIGIDNITYAGNHGLEINFANGTQYVYEVSMELRDNFTKMIEELENSVTKSGAWVENKHQSVTYHYREVPTEQEQNELRDEAKYIIEKYGYIANQAHRAIEAKPPVKWNKGEAAAYILRNEFGLDWPKNYRVIFAGDDTTDEDAMRVLKGNGLSFRISQNENIQTYADYRLPTTKTVANLLKWLLNRLTN